MAKLVERLLATAALWVRIQTSLKHTNGRREAKERLAHSSSPKKLTFWLDLIGCRLRDYENSSLYDNRKYIRFWSFQVSKIMETTTNYIMAVSVI